MAKPVKNAKNKSLTEREIAKYVISRLEDKNGYYSGICEVLKKKFRCKLSTGLERKLPKLNKHLSNRNNHIYIFSIFGGYNVGRIKGTHDRFYWTPFKHTNRIKTLKKVYNIK